jgi:glycosyltransferase 2 family protein
LFGILAVRFDLGQAASQMGHASLSLVVAALTVLLAANMLVAFRWHLILSFASTSPGPVALLKIVFVGLFFNQVLPTGVGGDAVRAWRCSKLGIGLGATIRSILLDRAWGYTVLVILYIIVLPSLLQVLPRSQERSGVVAVLAAAIAALLALVSLDYLPPPLLRLRVIAPLAELSREGRRLLMYPGRCGAVLCLSILTIGLTVVAFKFIGDAMGSRLSLGTWAMVVPPVALIQLLPVSLAGWGIREAALVVALGTFGVPAEAALGISILLGLCVILTALPGGLIWLTNWDLSQPCVMSALRSFTADE